MTDLTYCYIHMTANDLRVLDTIETPEYISAELNEVEIDVPAHLIPSNPEDSDILPSQMHPTYPHGNPRNAAHPANRPWGPYNPGSRALFEDSGPGGPGSGAGLHWKELALDALLPVDRTRAEAAKAAQARKMASGAGASAGQQQAPPAQGQGTMQPQLPGPPQGLPANGDTEDEGDEGDEEEEDDEGEDDDDVEGDEEDETEDEGIRDE